MKIKSIYPVLILTVICVIVAALLGTVNLLTRDTINEYEEQKIYESLKEALDGTVKPVETPDDAPDSVTALYEVYGDGNTLKGHVVTLVVKGYAADISLTVGVDTDGTVTKVIVTNSAETHGKAGMSSYPDMFTGVEADELADVETFSGATVSSGAIKNAVIDAVNVATGSSITSTEPDGGDEGEASLPKTDEEIYSLAKALAAQALGLNADSVSLTDVTPTYNKPKTLGKLYKDSDGRGYVAYVYTAGEYVPVANEAVVFIDMNGDIIAMNHLTWVVGNNISSEGFADKFIGEDYWSVGDVELISSATVTSGDLRAAVYSAVEQVTKSIDRTESKILELVDELVPNSKGFEKLTVPEEAPDTLKRLYKEKSGKGYVAYIVTPGEYVAVAVEGLVWFDSLGEIKDVRLLVWTVGHGVEPVGFADGFIGKNKETVEEVDLVTSATYTSADFRNAVAEAYPYIPTDFPIARVLGIVVIVLAAALTVAAVVIFKKKRRVGK